MRAMFWPMPLLWVKSYRSQDKQKAFWLQSNVWLSESRTFGSHHKRLRPTRHISFHIIESYHRFISPPAINTLLCCLLQSAALSAISSWSLFWNTGTMTWTSKAHGCMFWGHALFSRSNNLRNDSLSDRMELCRPCCRRTYRIIIISGGIRWSKRLPVYFSNSYLRDGCWGHSKAHLWTARGDGNTWYSHMVTYS